MGSLEQNTTLIYGIHLRESANDGSDFSNGATDYRVVFLGEDGQLHAKDSAGTVTALGGTPTFVGARVYNSSNIALNNGTDTLLTFNSERYDSDAFHSTVSNTGRLTVPSGKDGKYVITGNLDITASPGDGSYAFIRLNGATIIAVHGIINSASNTYVSVTTQYALVATDYVELGVQVQAASKNAIAAGNFSPEFSIALVGV